MGGSAAAGGDRVGHLHFGPNVTGPAIWPPSPALLDLPSEQYDLASYADPAIIARRSGIKDYARALYEQMLRHCFLNNTDDHLHNHAFIDDGNGWRLSPVFDLVPQAASGWTAEADPAQARTSFDRFGLSAAETRRNASTASKPPPTTCWNGWGIMASVRLTGPS